MKIAIVSDKEMLAVIPLAMPMLRKSFKLSDGRHSQESVTELLTSRKGQLWVAIEDGKIIMALVSEIRVYPELKTLAILLCGGIKMHLWLDDLIAKLKDVSGRHEIEKIETIGRPGWVRALRSHGFVEKPVYFLECKV